MRCHYFHNSNDWDLSVKDSKLLIIRSGDVIPHILKVIESTKPILPTKEYVLSESGIDAILVNETDDVKIKKIVNFFRVLKVDSLSIGIVKKLYNNNFDTIHKIINMEVSDLIFGDLSRFFKSRRISKYISK